MCATREVITAGKLSNHDGATSQLARVVFSFPGVCLALLATVVLLISAGRVGEPDIWWHLRNVQYLFANHRFPSIDTYSLTAAGAPWLNHEWLSEIPFYLAFQLAGLQGLLLVYFVVILAIYAGVYYLCCRAGADRKNAAIATLLAILLGEVSFGPLMLLFGWLCMVALMIILERFRATGRGLWLLPPVFAIWVNFHGSWVFGMVVLAIAIAGGLIEGRWGVVASRRWTPSEFKKLTIATFASIAALFVNPFGYKLVLYPFDLLFRQQTIMKNIHEWMSVDFQTGTGRLVLLVILSLLGTALLSARTWRLDTALLTAFALWAGLTHVRFLFFLGMVIAPVLAPALKLFPDYQAERDKPWLNAMLLVCIAGALVYFFPSQARLQAKVDQVYPSAALDFMRSHSIQGGIFNQDLFGGYMEWVAPQLKPFIDGRADIFVYNGTFDENLHAVSIENSFEILDKHHIQYVLLQPDQPLTYTLQHAPGWQTLYADKVAVLLQRAPIGDGPSVR